MALTAVLYNRNLTNPTAIAENLLGDKAENLRFSTQIPGGYATCSYDWKCGWVSAWEIYQSHYFYRLVLYEGISTIWEGRIEDIEMSPSGISVTAFGYWRACFDKVFNDTTSYVAGTHYSDAIIQDIILASCPDIHRDFSHITSPGFNLAPITFTDNQYPGDHFQRIGKLGDGSSNVPWYFAVWDGRTPYFSPKKTAFSDPDWYIFKRDLSGGGGLTLRRSVRDMWNRCATLYSSYDGMRVITDYVEDSDSISKWGITRERAVSMGEGGTETSASARDAYLKDHADPQQAATAMVIQRVQDKNRKTQDLWHVRAGDVLRVDDLIPEEAIIERPELDALRTFYIIETEFNLDNYNLTITPDSPGQSVEVALARADLGARF